MNLLLATVLSLAADAGAPQAAKPEEFKTMTAPQLSARLADKTHPVHVFDANHDEFRKKEGIIAGATLLASASDYDVAATLPKDKSATLVFYCSNKL